MMRALVLTVALLGLPASAAWAQVGPEVYALPPAERFAATDTNNDGRVSKEELLAVIQPEARPFIDSIWANRDTNGDGWLSEAEMNANSSGRAGRGGAAAGAAAAAAAAGRAGAAAPQADSN